MKLPEGITSDGDLITHTSPEPTGKIVCTISLTREEKEYVEGLLAVEFSKLRPSVSAAASPRALARKKLIVDILVKIEPRSAAQYAE